jgi:hypothetical protein
MINARIAPITTNHVVNETFIYYTYSLKGLGAKVSLNHYVVAAPGYFYPY